MVDNPRSNRALAPVSRRGFFGRAAVAGAGVMLGSGIQDENLRHQDESPRREEPARCGLQGLCDFPVPIPHLTPTPFGTQLHFFFPGPVEGAAVPTDPAGAHPAGRDPSLIYNFEGFIGQADLNLTGRGRDLAIGVTGDYQFHTDMRFMKGAFVGTDGIARRGTFVFI